MGSTIVDKAKGESKKPKDKGSSGGGVKSKSGMSKGIDKSTIDLDGMFEARDGELSVDVEEQLGYGIPLRVLDERSKGGGKSSDPAHPDIPRPVSDEKTTIVTCSPETKKGIIDRWGEVPEYVDILNVGKVWRRTQPQTAKEAAAAIEKFFENTDELCNLVIDDVERMHEELFTDVARAEYDVDAGEDPFNEDTQDYYKRRKNLDELLLAHAMETAQHLLWVSGYDGDWEEETREVDGEKREVQVYKPRRWVGYFEKPFDVILVGGQDTNTMDDEADSEDDVWTIRVRSSKVNRLFPQGARYDVTGVGAAKFWQVYEEQREAGDTTMHDATQEETTDDAD